MFHQGMDQASTPRYWAQFIGHNNFYLFSGLGEKNTFLEI